MALTDAQIAGYRRDGWIAPVDVLTEQEAAAVLACYEQTEETPAGRDQMVNRNNLHLVLPCLTELALNNTIVSCVKQLLGSSVSLWGSVMFIKEPSSEAFVSWHQDATYMGLQTDNFVTAWLALTASTKQSGCVAVIPNSHRNGLRQHTDQFGRNNILTRGQEVTDINEQSAVNLVLRPGQMSLHHPWLVHGSRPNQSNQRRVGVAFQSYLGADVTPVRGTHHVMPITGDKPGDGFVPVAAPSGLMVSDEVSRRDRVNRDLADILYDGSQTRRSL